MLDEARERTDESLIDQNGILTFCKTQWEDLFLQLFNCLLGTLTSPLLATYLFIDSTLHFYMIFWTHIILKNRVDFHRVLDLEAAVQSKII